MLGSISFCVQLRYDGSLECGKRWCVHTKGLLSVSSKQGRKFMSLPLGNRGSYLRMVGTWKLTFCMWGLFFPMWIWVGNRVQNEGGGLAEQSFPWVACPWWMLQAVRMPCKQSSHVRKHGALKALLSCPCVCCGIATSWVNTWAGDTTLTTVTSHKVIINQ